MIMSNHFITSSKLTKADLEDSFVVFFQDHLLKMAQLVVLWMVFKPEQWVLVQC